MIYIYIYDIYIWYIYMIFISGKYYLYDTKDISDIYDVCWYIMYAVCIESLSCTTKTYGCGSKNEDRSAPIAMDPGMDQLWVLTLDPDQKIWAEASPN